MIKNKENCYLRAFELEDYKITHKWRTDPEMTKLLTGNIFFVSSERERRWLEEKILDDRKEIYWAICDKETNEMVGMTSITNIDWRNRKVFWGGMTIAKEYWHKGYAMAANALVLNYVFEELGMNKITTNYLVEHNISRKILEKCGFKIEGIARQDIYKNGSFHDIEYVSLLKEEYFKIIEQ